MSKQVPWQNDLLARRKDAKYIYQLVNGRAKQHSGSVVINVDALWGQGKTYFLTNMYLDVLKRKHPAVKIDAWKYDYVDDPYTYVMAELDEYFQSLIAAKKADSKKQKSTKAIVREKADAVRANAGKLLWVGLKGAAKRAGRFAIAEGADEMIEVVEQYAPTSLANEAKGAIEDAEKQLVAVTDNIINAYIKKRLDDFSETKESLENFRENLTHLIDLLATKFEMRMPMYIFVDELDRCRPTYAIQMLERIKHLFDIPNLAFVIATDTTSLSHSIKAVYGSEFDSKQYLQRFFHRTYKLPPASQQRIIETMILLNGIDLQRWSHPDPDADTVTFAQFLDITSRKFGLTVRQAQQAVDVLIDITNASDDRFSLEVIFLFCLICEFISEGDLDRNNFARMEGKIKRFGSDWQGDYERTDVNYLNIIMQVYNYSRNDIETAFNNAMSEKRTSATINNRYLIQLIEHEHRFKRGKPRTKTEFYEYYDLINFAKYTLDDDPYEDEGKNLFADDNEGNANGGVSIRRGTT